MLLTRTDLPPDYHTAYDHITNLAQYPRYLGACVFGSVAKGYANAASDLDVKVMIDTPNPCGNLNHPPVHPTKKLDIMFLSFEQLHAATEHEIAQRERQPLLAGARIIFDTTGQLRVLIEQANRVQPPSFTTSDVQATHFLLYHANDKAARHVVTDPAAALLVMHTSSNELLKIHYRIQGHWWVSNKWLLGDLRAWDVPLARLVEAFLASGDVGQKFTLWSAIIDHILRPLGGRQAINENNCTCATCQIDLARLVHPETTALSIT